MKMQKALEDAGIKYKTGFMNKSKTQEEVLKNHVDQIGYVLSLTKKRFQ